MGLQDPLTESERRRVELRIEQIGNAWEREGEHVNADWEARNIEAIGRAIWQQRVAGRREQLELRIRQMADTSADSLAPSGTPGPAAPRPGAGPRSSEDWHRGLANPGQDEFGRFLRTRITPLYN